MMNTKNHCNLKKVLYLEAGEIPHINTSTSPTTAQPLNWYLRKTCKIKNKLLLRGKNTRV